MKSILRKINRITASFGINFKILPSGLKYFLLYLKEYMTFKKLIKSNTDFKKIEIYPCLFDKYDDAGSISGHYFHQDYFVAQKIYINKPSKHVDIGSRIDGFVAHVATFMQIEIFDIRNIISPYENIIYRHLDLLGDISQYENYTPSLSSLHVLEHIGLGRYGDTIDINGHIKAFDNIFKILMKNGVFYFSVPIGPQRIEFNAHRVFSIEYLLNLINQKYQIISFSYVDDNGDLHTDVALDELNIKNNFNCNFGCGIFELIKL